MTTQEFSDQFDILYNNIGSNQAPGINEYEKSVFLTKAERQLVREYFERTLNRTQTGFDDSIKRQYDFSSLIKTSKLYDITHHWNNNNLSLGQDTFNLDGVPFVLPLDYYLTVNELITDNANNKYCVLPLTYEEYQLRQSKPFPFPNKREAWRIITNQRGINYGTTSIKYKDVTGEGTTDVICYTTFASEGKNMKFSLKEKDDIYTSLSNLHGEGIIKDEVWNIINSFNNIDGYAALRREANYHNLEYISMTMHHNTEPGKVKLWDDDYIAKYTFDKVRDASGELVDCVYQVSGAIAVTSVTVTGEASALGLLKIYMHLTKYLENETIGHDPYTLIARITFQHWEEGNVKHGTWLIWNGGWSGSERINMVNVRHWDYADNFVWPQRIKFKDIKGFLTNSTIFDVEMTASTVPAVEIIGKFKNGIQSYMMRYVSKPKPIILEDLSQSGLSIDGYTRITECELPEDCHEEILERAVTLAKLAYDSSSVTLARANNNQ